MNILFVNDGRYIPYSKLCVYEPQEEVNVNCYSALVLYCNQVSCPLHYKCHLSYCIPIRHVCDGLADCISGEDEVMCSMMSCQGLFHCRDQTYCLPPWEVCDGTVHCTSQWKDDELYCEQCPAGCQCHGNAIYCTNSAVQLRDNHEDNFASINR
jgi:hypothetical protein